MKLAALCFALVLAPALGKADEFTREARAGQRALMRSYANFNIISCAGHLGTVSVVSKPANGRLTTSAGPYVVGVNRFTGSTSRCAGKKIIGLNVYYTPDRGFRGTDRFSVRAVYRDGLLSIVDRYTVSVR